MSSTYVRTQSAARTRRGRRAQTISLLGPATVAAGVVWAVVQPYRLTLVHPLHQGAWWLLIEPQVLVMLAGVFFALVVARPLLADLAEREG